MAKKVPPYRPQTKTSYYAGTKTPPRRPVTVTVPKGPAGVRPQARPGSFTPPKIVTTKKPGGGGGKPAAGAGRAGTGYVPPQLPDFYAPPTQTPMADLTAQTRALVETVYGPQRQQIEQQIADEAARSSARAAQMAGIYQQLGQFVQSQQGDIQNIYRNAAGDMANFNKGWSDGANLSAAQASAAEQANLNYLGSPQTAAPYGSAGKIAEAGQQIAGALETAGAGWGSYAATLPGIYTRMGALDIRQMLGEGAQRETQLRQGLTELGSKEAADILSYLTETQKTQAQQYADWQSGRAKYQQWAYEQRGQARKDWVNQQLAVGKLRLQGQQLAQSNAWKQRNFRASQYWKGVAATQAGQRIGVSRGLGLIAAHRETRAQQHEDFWQQQTIRRGNQSDQRYYQSVARDLSKSGTMYVYDPKFGVKILRDKKGNPVLTADERHFQNTFSLAQQTLNFTQWKGKQSVQQRWATLHQTDTRIRLEGLKLQEKIRETTARLKLAKLSADQRRIAQQNLQTYRNSMLALRTQSNKIAQQRATAAIGNAALTKQNKRDTAINKVRTAIWRDMPVRTWPGGASFNKIYTFYLKQYRDTLKPWDAIGELDRIIRAAMPYRKFGKKKTGAGTTGAPWAQTPS